MAERLLEIRGLKTHFRTDDGMVRAVDGVDLVIDRGETLGVVGEFGCGKTVTAMTVLKLIEMPPGRIVEGSVLWQGRDLVPLGADEMRQIRSKRDRHHLPGADDLAESRLHGGRADRRDHPAARGPEPPGGDGPGRRDAAPGADPDARNAGARLSAPVLRRHAPARDDRDGAVVQAASC